MRGHVLFQPPTARRASHSAFFRAKILCRIQKWVRDHQRDCLSAGIPFRPLDPLSTINFIITEFRIAKQEGDETYSKLFGNMKDLKVSWDSAVARQRITIDTGEDVIHQPWEKVTYTPTSPSYAPRPSPTAPSEGPSLKIKKKIYCLYRSHAQADNTRISPWLYRYLPAPEDRPILPSFRASTLRKKPPTFRRAKFCLCRSFKIAGNGIAMGATQRAAGFHTSPLTTPAPRRTTDGRNARRPSSRGGRSRG